MRASSDDELSLPNRWIPATVASIACSSFVPSSFVQATYASATQRASFTYQLLQRIEFLFTTQSL